MEEAPKIDTDKTLDEGQAEEFVDVSNLEKKSKFGPKMRALGLVGFGAISALVGRGTVKDAHDGELQFQKDGRAIASAVAEAKDKIRESLGMKSETENSIDGAFKQADMNISQMADLNGDFSSKIFAKIGTNYKRFIDLAVLSKSTHVDDMKKDALTLYYLMDIKTPEDEKSKQQLTLAIANQEEVFKASYGIVKDEREMKAISNTVDGMKNATDAAFGGFEKVKDKVRENTK